MGLSWLLVLCFALAVLNFDSGGSLSQDAILLLGFKASIAGDPSNVLSSWNASSADHCSWFGVTCSQVSGRVVALNVTGGSLQATCSPPYTHTRDSNVSVLVGTLPALVGNMTELRVLSLPHNAFSGVVPQEIGNLRYLEILELQGNNFTGRIPRQIRHLSSLRLLNLSYNSFSGPIPDGLIGFGRLSAIDLSNNQLSGPLSVDEFSTCEFLHHLKLSHNFLVNHIPAKLGKCSNVRTLLLDTNIFEGKIPTEIGQISELRVLDVSRNSLVDAIPRELANCRKISVIVLTNLVDFSSSFDDGSAEFIRGEFNAFDGGVPSEVLMLPNLQIFWAPRANLGGPLPGYWDKTCSLRVLNLGLNNVTGRIPESLAACRNMTFLDFSLNGLQGDLPAWLQVPCMTYFNVSQNSFSGVLPMFGNGSCNVSMISYGKDSSFLDEEDIQNAYCNIPGLWSQINTLFDSELDDNLVVAHDFSWNGFVGSLPIFSISDEFGDYFSRASYRLFLNNNRFNETLPVKLFSNCNDLQSFSINLSANQLSGELYREFLLDCLRLTVFEAAENHIEGPIPPQIGRLKMLQHLDISANKLSKSLPHQLGELQYLKLVLLGQNNLTGPIPSQLGQSTSLVVLDLSHNDLMESIPATLAKARNLEVLLLNHNRLSGEIPSSFSTLSSLTLLDLSFNNLSGHIPHLQRLSSCDSFKENMYLHSCPDQDSASPAPFKGKEQHRRKFKSFVIALAISASVVVCVLVVLVLFPVIGRKKLSRLTSLRRKVVVTFADAPNELNYDNVVRATGNFSIRNLIGTGGFGSTYMAELAPGFLIAVKRLSVGRFHGIQQFDAEIRTLGRIRHKNLVTLIGYYVAEAEMFLIYNYLCGGNLETFIHERSYKNVQYHVINKIAIDIAQALTFLHYSCVPRIVHRDIKPSNILLDEELNAYISDFGLARLLEVSETHATTDVAGTFGYVAPEYATTCRVSDKADVYSFGVVLLEMISGKKSLDPSFSDYGNGFNIVIWAQLLIKEGRFHQLFSSQLWESGPRENLLGMLRLASYCTEESLSIRPSMKQVLDRLKQLKA